MKKSLMWWSAVCALMLSAPSIAETVKIQPNNMKDWLFFDDGTGGACFATSTCDLVTGPANAPGGIGSARLATSTAADRPTLGALNSGIAGQKISDFQELSYATYVTSNTGVEAIAFQFDVEKDITNVSSAFQGRLVYEPYVNGEVKKANGRPGICWLASGG